MKLELKPKGIQEIVESHDPTIHSLPENSERNYIKSGGKFLIAVNQRWIKQWWGEIDGQPEDPVAIWISPDGETGEKLLYTYLAFEDVKRKLEESDVDFVVKKLQKVGDSFYLSIPKKWIEDKLGWSKKDKLVMMSNGLLGTGRATSSIVDGVVEKIHETIVGEE